MIPWRSENDRVPGPQTGQTTPDPESSCAGKGHLASGFRGSKLKSVFHPVNRARRSSIGSFAKRFTCFEEVWNIHRLFHHCRHSSGECWEELDTGTGLGLPIVARIVESRVLGPVGVEGDCQFFPLGALFPVRWSLFYNNCRADVAESAARGRSGLDGAKRRAQSVGRKRRKTDDRRPRAEGRGRRAEGGKGDADAGEHRADGETGGVRFAQWRLSTAGGLWDAFVMATTGRNPAALALDVGGA